MSTASTILTNIVPVLSTLINDIPAAVEVIDLVLPALKEGRNLTSDEWSQLNALADKAAANLADNSAAATGASK